MLAALIIHAVSHLWKIAEFRRYYRRATARVLARRWRRSLGVITFDVLPGLVIGVVSMLLLVIYHASRPHSACSARVPGVPDAYGDVGATPTTTPARAAGAAARGPLFYANAALVSDAIKALVGESDPIPAP